MTTVSLYSRLADLLHPRGCAVCGSRLAPGETLICTPCMAALPRTEHAYDPTDNEMARLFWARINIERAAALFFYSPGSATGRLIYKLKYDSRPQIGRALGRLAAEEFSVNGFFDDIDMIVPIPLDKKRERMRGYNQSAEIALGISEATGIGVRTDIVRRVRQTESQTLKAHSERADNVEGAFRTDKPEVIRERHILVVDDIVTTGSTVCSCGKELMKAGDVKISVISLGFTSK